MWSNAFQSTTGEKSEYNYNDIPIYCAPGVYERVFSLIQKKFLKKDIKILVLGAGSGAFDERLLENGYCDITAVEFRPEAYKSKGKVLGLDLNENFSSLLEEKFDCIVAIEIIEHLENHFHFIREIDKLLKEEGRLYVTTPNTESSLARVKFWLFGDIPCFTKASIIETGHINPLFKDIFLYHLENNTGMKLENIFTNVSVWDMKSGAYKNLKLKLMLVVAFIFSLIITKKDNMQIRIFEISKFS